MEEQKNPLDSVVARAKARWQVMPSNMRMALLLAAASIGGLALFLSAPATETSDAILFNGLEPARSWLS